MKIALGCDHGGLSLKAEVVKLLLELGHVVADQGCHSDESVDYPDFARAVCVQVQNGSCERGILICGTGVGMSMAANRFEGIRAGLGNELFTAQMSREHNDANVLCLGARVIGPGLAGEIVRTWVSTEFAGGRHQRRIDMF
ncbi:MAG: ribose 5-phosphate isomerase B [Deltaproteobacteria bacterium RIFOXYD12_FULL_55_16]|nr:MAG: ribose 5-phosphate isomerase B [Deltaproteobacteria bacterium RIFOXYD12_FULL_55_16]